MNENQNHNTNHTKQEITSILDCIRDCIYENQFTVSRNSNREENIRFMSKYRLNREKQKEILLDIDVLDFCYSLQNNNIGYEYETLYVFCLRKTLYDASGIADVVEIYIKFNILDNANSNYVVTISLHNLNNPITYLFR